MQRTPDPNAVPYHIVHYTVASITDDDSPLVVVTEDNGIQRPHANTPEGLHVDWYEGDTGYSVERHVTLGAGYWDVDSRDMCYLVAVEERGREDKRREPMGERDGALYAVLKYVKDTEGGGFGAVETPAYDLPEKYGSGRVRRVKLTDFLDRTIRGKRHDLKRYANHCNKSLDDVQWLRQRQFGDPSELPP